MIRVGIIITRMVAGGASGIVRSLIKGGAGGFEFVLMTGDEDVQTGEIDALKEFCDIRLVSDLRRAISPFCDFRAYPNLRREIRGLALDVVHTHTSKAGVLGRFAACAEGVPQIIHSTHGSIYEVGGRIEGVPEISIFKRCLLLIERAAGKRADFLTVLSERERSAAVEFGLDIDA
ncbi:MAG: glycosyltransferase, partial [Victivallales bacterium]|nr:glycosyltransferase [Victivallales bacterium]